MWLVHRSRRKRGVNRTFRSLQLVSAAAFSLGHGANDAQKTMGIIAALLVGADKLEPDVLERVRRDAAVDRAVVSQRDRAWHDVRRLAYRAHDGHQADALAADGRRVRRKSPRRRRCSSRRTTAFPVSTTHTITGAIVGVGSANRMSAVRWNVARRVVWAWVFTIPGAAIVAMLSYWFVAVVS